MHQPQPPDTPALAPLDPHSLRAALASTKHPYPGPRLLPRTLGGESIPRLMAPPNGQQARRAAVLLLLYPHQGRATLLLIRRPEYDGHHSGQIGLPGGSIEPGDGTPLDAALREAEEEVGLERAGLEVWGGLDPVYIPVSNFMVEPFVAWSPVRPTLRPDPNEVAEVLEAPLANFMAPRSVGEEEWTLRGHRLIVPFFRLGPHKVWGATAAILDQVVWRLQQALAD